MKKYSFLFLLIFFLSCSSDRQFETKTTQRHPTSLAEPNNNFSNTVEKQKKDLNTNAPISMETPDFNRKMIKRADYKFEVENVDESTIKMHQLAEQYSGFVSGMNLSTSANAMTNRMTIKVMNEQFEPLLTALSNEAIFVHHKRINTQDVTEQFVDLESRLNVKKDVKERYTKMLRNDAKTMQQVFHAEEKIRVLQEEIESKEGRLRLLADQVSLSEIQLEMVQEVEYQEKLLVKNKSFAQKATDSFLNGWNSILSVTLGMLNYWHVGVLLGMMWWMRGGVFQVIRRFRK